MIRPGRTRSQGRRERASGRHVLALTYWPFKGPLVRSAVLPHLSLILNELGPEGRITLVTLDPDDPQGTLPELDPRVTRMSFRYRRVGKGAVLMILGMMIRLWLHVLLARVHMIHAWCTPAGAVGYLLALLTGRPLTIDSYEPHAEAMVENGSWPRGGVAHRVLFALERLQSRKAVNLIGVTESMAVYANSRYGDLRARFFVKPACVDLDAFSWRNVKRPDLLERYGLTDKRVCVYAGKFGGIYMGQEVFQLFRAGREHWGERFHVLLFTPHALEELHEWMKSTGCPRDMFTIMYVENDRMPDLLGLADMAVTPVMPVPTKRHCTPIKDGEYWALGLPVIIPDGVSDDAGIINELGIGSVLKTLDMPAYRQAIEQIDQLIQGRSRRALYDLIRPVAEEHRSFLIAGRIYHRIYGSSG